MNDQGIAERFHTHIEHAAGNHLNDDHTTFPNKIFEALRKQNTHPLEAIRHETPNQPNLTIPTLALTILLRNNVPAPRFIIRHST